MRELVDDNNKFVGRGKALHDLNALARGCAKRAAEIVHILDAIPFAAMAERSSTVRRPGSPEAVVGVGSGSPSVWARSYLENPQPPRRRQHGSCAALVSSGLTDPAGSDSASGLWCQLLLDSLTVNRTTAVTRHSFGASGLHSAHPG
jgi:hypothetical protein